MLKIYKITMSYCLLTISTSLVLSSFPHVRLDQKYGKITPKLVRDTGKAISYVGSVVAFLPLIEGQKVRDCSPFVLSCLGVVLIGVLLFDYQKEICQKLQVLLQNSVRC